MSLNKLRNKDSDLENKNLEEMVISSIISAGKNRSEAEKIVNALKDQIEGYTINLALELGEENIREGLKRGLQTAIFNLITPNNIPDDKSILHRIASIFKMFQDTGVLTSLTELIIEKERLANTVSQLRRNSQAMALNVADVLKDDAKLEKKLSDLKAEYKHALMKIKDLFEIIKSVLERKSNHQYPKILDRSDMALSKERLKGDLSKMLLKVEKNLDIYGLRQKILLFAQVKSKNPVLSSKLLQMRRPFNRALLDLFLEFFKADYSIVEDQLILRDLENLYVGFLKMPDKDQVENLDLFLKRIVIALEKILKDPGFQREARILLEGIVPNEIQKILERNGNILDFSDLMKVNLSLFLFNPESILDDTQIPEENLVPVVINEVVIHIAEIGLDLSDKTGGIIIGDRASKKIEHLEMDSFNNVSTKIFEEVIKYILPILEGIYEAEALNSDNAHHSYLRQMREWEARVGKDEELEEFLTGLNSDTVEENKVQLENIEKGQEGIDEEEEDLEMLDSGIFDRPDEEEREEGMEEEVGLDTQEIEISIDVDEDFDKGSED